MPVRGDEWSTRPQQRRRQRSQGPPATLASAPQVWLDTVKQSPKCGHQCSGGCSGGTGPRLTPLAISQVWKYQLFCWEEKKTSPGPKPSCGSYCFYSPTLTRTLQLSFGPIASGKLLPLKATHGPATKSVPPLKPPLNAGAWRAPLPSSLQSNRPPALVPSDHSSVFFAASSLSAHLLLFSLYLGIH